MKKRPGDNKALPAGQGGSAAPSLREFWETLKKARDAGATLPCAGSSPGGASAATAAAVPSSGGSGQGGSGGSGGAGYGLGLVVPDEASRRRIARILCELCARDKERKG